MFADLKKHLFSYQFYSSAIPVKNYSLTHWQKFEEVYPGDQKTKLTAIIKEAAQEKLFPQFMVLNANFERVPFQEYLDKK